MFYVSTKALHGLIDFNILYDSVVTDQRSGLRWSW